MPSRRSIRLSLALVALPALALAACGDSTGGSTSGGGDGSGACLDSLAPAKNAEFCQATPSNPDCDGVTGEYKNQVCGVPLKQPPAELVRATDVDEFGGSGPPDVSCFAVATYPPPPGPSAPVTLRGHARIFSNGCESNNVTIEVFTVQPDGQLGQSIGSVTTPASCAEDGESTEFEDCGTRIECAYEIPNVPSETPLAVKTTGPLWQALVAYNVYVPTSQIVDGAFEYDPRALAQDDYGLIAQVSPLGRPITAGNGAVAGEVHDCGDVRVANAVADVDVFKRSLTYFSSNEDNPLPDVNALATSQLGLYAVLDVAPGPATVAAAGLVNGEVVTLGHHQVYVYPDTVTSLTFRGLRPTQVP